MRHSSLLPATLCVILTGSVALSVEPSVSNWPQFRGPSGDGQVHGTNLPTTWNAQTVKWSVDLPVSGHSSPTIWGDKIFLTGATRQGDSVRRHVICLDRTNGKLLWNQVAATGTGEKLHQMNSWATPSCATDGTHVAAFFGPGGLHCYSMDGELQWSRQLGDFPGKWGVGASPVIMGDKVIQNCDAEGNSFLLAVQKSSGRDIWKTSRKAKPRGGWSTPLVTSLGGKTRLVLNGEFGVSSYDPETGQQQWNCNSFNGRGTPMPVVSKDLIHVVNGKSGDVYAIKPGGKGDVTETHMAWHTERRGGRDLPSPVLCGDTMVVIGMEGIATGYHAADGSQLWKERVGGKYAGSPIVADGIVYALAENGETAVFRASNGFEMISTNPVGNTGDEVFRSSPSVASGQLFLRSNTRLYCVSDR